MTTQNRARANSPLLKGEQRHYKSIIEPTTITIPSPAITAAAAITTATATATAATEATAAATATTTKKQSVTTSQFHRWHLNIASVGAFPTEFTWAMGECLIVPFLLSCGCPYFMTSYVWLFSPIMDSWLQPLYSQWSDNLAKRSDVCCGFGGRKPFLLFFAILASLGLIVTPFSINIASWLVPRQREDRNNEVLWLSVCIALVGYTIMDTSHGHMLIPARSLMSDIAYTRKEVDEANSRFCLFQALGRVCGTLLLCVNWTDYFAGSLFQTQFEICFVFGLIPLWLAVGLVLVFTPHQLSRVWGEKRKKQEAEKHRHESKKKKRKKW